MTSLKEWTGEGRFLTWKLNKTFLCLAWLLYYITICLAWLLYYITSRASFTDEQLQHRYIYIFLATTIICNLSALNSFVCWRQESTLYPKLLSILKGNYLGRNDIVFILKTCSKEHFFLRKRRLHFAVSFPAGRKSEWNFEISLSILKQSVVK